MTDPLFDISGHDLSNVHVPPNRLDELLPQCGDMRQVDRVVWIDDTSKYAIGVKEVRDDEFWVPGHIPGRGRPDAYRDDGHTLETHNI